MRFNMTEDKENKNSVIVYLSALFGFLFLFFAAIISLVIEVFKKDD